MNFQHHFKFMERLKIADRILEFSAILYQKKADKILGIRTRNEKGKYKIQLN